LTNAPPGEAGGGKAAISIAMQWKLLDRTFTLKQVVSAIVPIGIFAMTLWARTQSPAVPVWGALAIGMVIARHTIARAYWRCEERDDPRLWEGRFTWCVWSSATLWGLLGLGILLVADPVVHLLVVGAQYGYLFAIISRNGSMPRTANGQVLLVKLPLALCCFLTEDAVYLMFGIGTLAEIAVLRTRVALIHRQTIDELELNEQLLMTRDELEATNRQLEALATTDALTGIPNRRAFDIAFRREWRRALRERHPVSLLLLDLDHFKKLNDTLGHQAGDACLRQVARRIAETVRRPIDLAARYGGEEFAVLLPATDALVARQIGERLCAAIAALRLAHPASPFGMATVSAGCATLVPDETLMAAVLIERADEALYSAKNAGRNLVWVWDALPPRPPPSSHHTSILHSSPRAAPARAPAPAPSRRSASPAR
jgi:diguanylate cyclase (GGDEF)-like protein